MPLAAILSLIAKFIPDAEQRQKAEGAVRDAYAKFLETTSGPLYAALRALEILGALWDAVFNQGRAWAATAENLSKSPAGAIELLIILWPFIGEAVVGPAVQAITQLLARVTPTLNKIQGPSDTKPDRPEKGD